MNWNGKSAGITAQVESEVGDPNLHLSVYPALMPPSHLAATGQGSPPLSLSFLRPLTGSPTTFPEREPPPPPAPLPDITAVVIPSTFRFSNTSQL